MPPQSWPTTTALLDRQRVEQAGEIADEMVDRSTRSTASGALVSP